MLKFVEQSSRFSRFIMLKNKIFKICYFQGPGKKLRWGHLGSLSTIDKTVNYAKNDLFGTQNCYENTEIHGMRLTQKSSR